MKTNCWLILGTMIAASAIAQDTNVWQPMPTPAATITQPPAPRSRTAAPRRVAFAEPTVTLVAGPAEVTVSNLIVRGQAGLKGEVVAHVLKGDSVTVLSQINLEKHAAGEPAQWAKIAFPKNGKVWVSAKYIDETNKVVLPKKLNLRAGPGEIYSVVGVLERGAPVSEIVTKDGWMQIDPPANAYAFVAAMYLKQEASGNPATNTAPSTETETTTTTNNIPEPAPIVTEPTNPAPEAVETTPPFVTTPPVEVETNLPPPPPRVVTHEGVVRPSPSIIAPTDYELYDPKTGQEIDFLYTTATNLDGTKLDLSRYVGMRINVTGEEGLAARWPDVPVLTIGPGGSIQVIDTNAIPIRVIRSPRAMEQHR